MYVTYEVIRSNKEWATKRREPKLETTPVTLTFDLSSWKWCATQPLMCCMYATYAVIQSYKEEATDWTRQKLQMVHVTLIFDLLSWKWSATHRPLMCCMYAKYEVIRSNNEEDTGQTRQELQMTRVTCNSNDWRDLDLGPFDLAMNCVTLLSHWLCLC